ncbi:phenylalanine--tRNA ligase subunit beta [Garciella nitratireducens]|uniref:Phenylalanine--tRNA ligase beta subunit n=1 Tax=Garciella nitratireducens DSM 15102 TaxID=1121911 RepID=A0A1T4K321_9FIRM|nr:phenylalanine--tRNA ligase subunit beta [Garciella nitratireducens]SJZ36850.1 phenylalanyl-tRNA synthetase beta subunit [Garciella nitratireducens DSM 15102]
MLAPIKWLKEYVEINISIEEFVERMTMSGSKVEKIENIGEKIQKVVVGKILEIYSHPNADRLVVTKVDVGSEVLQIVTGAKNISEGDYIPVALVGSTLPGGVKIKKSKLRGIESQGMMCSAQELALDMEALPQKQVRGIYIFEKEYPLGMDVKEIFGLDDKIIEFELTNNRPDCLSIIGIAREAAATLGKNLVLPEIIIKKEEDNIQNYIDVEVKDVELCQRYLAKMVKNIKIQPSPRWMQDRLMKVGIRPINNVVDVTNYVMMELGQPLHAYDYNKLKGEKIIVRKAYEGETLTTLDGNKYKLDPSILMIADSNGSLGIAGVMGGENSEIEQDTNMILLEAAAFDPNNIRLTSKKLGLRTEASVRFEKGVDPNLAELAIQRAAQLLEEINAGTVVEGMIDRYEKVVEPHYIFVDPCWINEFIGIQITEKQMASYLESLDMEVEIGKVLKVKVPTFRQDLKIPEDIAEEIARLYGYNKIPSTMMLGITVEAKRTAKQKLEDKIKKILVGQGANEIYTYSFNAPQILDQLKISLEDEYRNRIQIINPLGEENSMMRTILMGNMMQIISYNIHHTIEEGFLFELANTYRPKQIPIEELPQQVKSLCIGMYGNIDFFDLKGIVENLLDLCGIKKYEFEGIEYPTFHPGRTAQVIYKGENLGILGEIHPDVAENFDISQRVYIAEFNMELLNQFSNLQKTYQTLPKYPSVTRDIALLLKEEVPAREVEKIIERQQSDMIESYSLFDVYQGRQIPKGYKSLAYSIVYRKKNGTLIDEEVNKIHNKIIKELQENLKAQLRD